MSKEVEKIYVEFADCSGGGLVPNVLAAEEQALTNPDIAALTSFAYQLQGIYTDIPTFYKRCRRLGDIGLTPDEMYETLRSAGFLVQTEGVYFTVDSRRSTPLLASTPSR